MFTPRKRIMLEFWVPFFIIIVLTVLALYLGRIRSNKSLYEKPIREAAEAILRREPAIISKKTIRIEYGLNVYWRPVSFTRNKYRNNNDGTISDFETGLVWQQSGSDLSVQYQEIPKIIKRLNKMSFAGHADWRLPTVPELMSLILEKRVKMNGLFIDPIFDKKQIFCWTADTSLDNSIWMIDFFEGRVYWGEKHFVSSVRAVRTMNKEAQMHN